jgi:alpha-galactosidase
MDLKIVIIGAGSANFGPSTLATILRSKQLKGAHLGLVDINEMALKSMAELAEHLNQEWSAGMHIMFSSDRSLVLDNADFVVVSIEVPPREQHWRLDWEIPLRHGLRQPYAENGGPGGFMHACRQIPPFLDIVRDMELQCPNAWLINFSNPLPRITRAVTKFSQMKIIGKCHQIDVGYAIAAALLAEHFGLDIAQDIDFHSDPKNTDQIRRAAALGKNHFEIKAAGLNHFSWIMDIRDRVTGEDLYPLLRSEAERSPSHFEPLSMELFRLFDYCPVPGDGHLSEYLPWVHDKHTRPWEYYNIRLYDWELSEDQRRRHHVRLGQMSRSNDLVDSLANVKSEGAVEIIEAIALNTEHRDDAVNIPNGKAIHNLPAESIVEVPALIASMGVEARQIGPLPEPIAELCRREAALVELVVDAAVSGDRGLAIKALLMDPMIGDIRQAKAILDDYLIAFSDYLPQFT